MLNVIGTTFSVQWKSNSWNIHSSFIPVRLGLFFFSNPRHNLIVSEVRTIFYEKRN